MSSVRNFGPRGPRFYETDDREEGGETVPGGLMFVNVFDTATREGPRQATREDTLLHPEAWRLFTAEVAAGEVVEAARSAYVEAMQAKGGTVAEREAKAQAAAAKARAVAEEAVKEVGGFDPFRKLAEIVTAPEPEPEPSPYAAAREAARLKALSEGRKAEGAA